MICLFSLPIPLNLPDQSRHEPLPLGPRRRQAADEVPRPSEATLRFNLIQRGFTPASADSTLMVFKRSVEFAKFFEQQPVAILDDTEDNESGQSDSQETSAEHSIRREPEPSSLDRIPVRLTGGRRAWLEIPTPFYEADKLRLIAQINLVLTDEDT
jgi:hypothetical protein